MRPKVLLACALILAFCTWLVAHRLTKQSKIADSPNSGASVPNSVTNKQSAYSPMSPQPAALRHAPNIPPPVSTTAITEDTNIRYQKMLSMWQTPIDFYGKVIDEHSNAVAGASIQFVWNETPTQEDGDKATAESDANGLFSLENKHGPNLELSVSKAGYYSSRKDQTAFSYGLGGNFSPSMANPVLFHLRKKNKGAALVVTKFPVGTGQIAQLHHDGTPAGLDLLKGGEVSLGNAQLELEFWRDLSNENTKIFDWKLRLSVPGGGLIPTDDEFAFDAPVTGYQPAVVIDMPATNHNWQSELRNRYYIQLANGDYGRMDVYLLPYNGVFAVQSAINPSGSTDLEPAQP